LVEQISIGRLEGGRAFEGGGGFRQRW
jgi:hypothetical protein